MTRRIALAILLTVWAILVAGCITAYVAVRWALVEELDEALATRASSLPELLASTAAAAAPNRRDHYVIVTEDGIKLSPPAGGLAASKATLQSASFFRADDGLLLRRMSLRSVVRDPVGNLTPVTINYQAPADHLDQTLNRLAWGFAGFGLLAGVLSAMMAVRVSRAALKPLHSTAEVIGTIDSSHLDRRIESAKLPPELAPMAEKLNEMLGRIEQAYDQRQRFLADASHELRTPVAAMVTTLEVALRKPREAAHYRATIETCMTDARLLRELVERLMEQCRAQSLTHDEPAESLDLIPLLTQCVSQARALASTRDVTVDCDLPMRLHASVQPQRLRSVVINLLGNAVEYNRPGGAVTLRAATTDSRIEICVSDTGIGIAEKDVPHLFEPFYRADAARTGVVAGHMGLGLSLVQAHIQAMRGTIDVDSKLGEGTRISVSVPLTSPPDHSNLAAPTRPDVEFTHATQRH